MKKNLFFYTRWVVGLLFVFSGLIKVNDPLGLAFKMQEFFEAWGWTFFHDYALVFALVMNVFEVVAGVALITGWRFQQISWLLLALMGMFTFLTAYALFSGKIKTCGCFGDCLPLTPLQSFVKDLVLLVAIVFLLREREYIYKHAPLGNWSLPIWVAAGVSAVLQGFVLLHLPFVDCLPYKEGNNLVEKMATPAGAIADSMGIELEYQHQGKTLFFDAAHFPADFDSTYVFVGRKDKLIKKGNGLKAEIPDFSLKTIAGNDTTEALLNAPKLVVLVLVPNTSSVADWSPKVFPVMEELTQKGIDCFLVTAETAVFSALTKSDWILSCDATVLKTAARVSPTYVVLGKGVVLKKRAWRDVAGPQDLGIKE